MNRPIHSETPLLENAIINQRLGKRILLKMDCYQPSGSFKLRGIGYRCQQAVAEGKTHLVSSSGGNAGYSAAYAGRMLGVSVTVVVPENTPHHARERILGEGAELIVHGAVWDEANALALALVKERDAAFIHPFDHPQIWEGHQSLIAESAQQTRLKPDVVVLSVGGGGLLCGVAAGLHAQGWADVPIIAVETEGAASFAKSVAAGERIRLTEMTSIANTLGALQVSAQSLLWSQQHPILPRLVSDADAVDACLRFADELRVLVEPACGASLSLLYRNANLLDGFETVLMVVCGGIGATIQNLLHAQAQLAPL